MTSELELLEVTPEVFKTLANKKYFSGDEVKIGDKTGFGLFVTESPETFIFASYREDEVGSIYTISDRRGKLLVLSRVS